MPSWGTNCGGRLAGGVVGGGARHQTKPGEEEQIGCWQGFGLVVGEDKRGAKHQTELRREDNIWVLDCQRSGGGGSEATERAGRKEQTELRC